jgi:hypothetical protein
MRWVIVGSPPPQPAFAHRTNPPLQPALGRLFRDVIPRAYGDCSGSGTIASIFTNAFFGSAETPIALRAGCGSEKNSA